MKRYTKKKKQAMAMDLHDDIGPLLMALKLKLLQADTFVKDDTNAAQWIGEAKSLVDDVIGCIKRLAGSCLEDREAFVLQSELKAFINHLNTLGLMKIDCSCKGDGNVRHPGIQLELFKAAKEILCNILKHSGASHAKVMLTIKADRIEFRVNDNGKQFSPEEAKPGKLPGGEGVGLYSIRHRLERIKGVFRYRRMNNCNSTTITIQCNFPAHGKDNCSR